MSSPILNFMSSVNQLSVTKKTTLLFLIMVFGMLFIGSFAHLSLNRIKNEFDILYTKHTVPIIKLEALKDVYTVNILDTLRDIEIHKISIKDGKTIITLAQELVHRFWFEYLESLEIDESDWIVKVFRKWGILPRYEQMRLPLLKQDLISHADHAIGKIDAILIQMFKHFEAREEDKAFLYLQEELYPSIHSVNIHLTQLIDFSLEAAHAGKIRTDRVYSNTFEWIVAGVVGTIVFAALFALVILQNIRLLYAHLEKIIEDKTKALVELNQDLELRVIEEIEKSRKKDEIMYRQARLAAMGEMIGNIAHQWRQPLNALVVLIQSFQFKYMQGKLNEEFIDSQVKEGLMLAENMSKTIDDFRNFFYPEKEKHSFNVTENINSSIQMLQNFYSKEDISITLLVKRDFKISGFANEFSQVIMNLLSNSKDSLSKKSPPKLVEIVIDGNDNECIIVVVDNGGGIKESVIDRMFDPYFSTKHQASGTGIGLYMSKQIIEKQMQGEILAKNIEHEFQNGRFEKKCAAIEIRIPLSV